MSTIRLTNSDRFSIKNSLINNHFKKNVKPLLDNASDMASTLMLDCYPKDVLAFQEKYPEFTNIRSTSIFVYKLVENGIYRYSDKTSIKVNNVSNGLFEGLDGCDYSEIIKKLKCSKEFTSLCKKIYDIYSKEVDLEGKILCVLDSINTVKKLKEEFPEGYKAYYEIPIDSNNSNTCDDIEKVRAELNSKTNKNK